MLLFFSVSQMLSPFCQVFPNAQIGILLPEILAGALKNVVQGEGLPNAYLDEG